VKDILTTMDLRRRLLQLDKWIIKNTNICNSKQFFDSTQVRCSMNEKDGQFFSMLYKRWYSVPAWFHSLHQQLKCAYRKTPTLGKYTIRLHPFFVFVSFILWQ
jgi:hypothetical protein